MPSEFLIQKILWATNTDAMQLSTMAISDNKQYGKWYVSMNLFYMVHGTHDKWTLWTDVSDASLYVSTPSTQHNTGNNGDLGAETARNTASNTIILGLSGGYTVIENLNLYGEADYIFIENPGNISSNAPIYDIQLTIGVSYSL